ncbi:MAG: glycosyltransferase family 2 protein [Bacteroidota bacterium]
MNRTQAREQTVVWEALAPEPAGAAVRNTHATGGATISVVIPYFQRKPGILSAALRSIAAQQGLDGHAVQILIVDDGSLAPPEPELASVQLPPAFSARIIRQPNSGPAAARNTGLAAVEPSCEYVAFLDSDDTWEPNHLSTALSALRHGEFYFGDIWYDDAATWFDGLAHFRTEETQRAATAIDREAAVFSFPGDSGMKFLLRECVPHTSTVVYAFKRHCDLRFDPRLRMAGEDYLFWLRLCRASQGTCYSLRPIARRGHGIDLYRSALNWDSPECIRRLSYKLILYRQLYREFGAAGDEADLLGMIHRLRLSISYLMLRNMLRHPAVNLDVLWQLKHQDPALFFGMPLMAARALFSRLAGRLDFAVG